MPDNNEEVNFPTQNSRRVATDIRPSDARDFAGNPANAMNTETEPGGAGFSTVFTGRVPASARTLNGPALNWDWRYVNANVPLDTDFGFPVSTVQVDNYTGQFLFVPMAMRYVPPFTVGVVLQLQQAAERIQIKWEAPPGVTQPPAVIAGSQAYVMFQERDDIAPAPGYRIDGVGGSNIPASTATAAVPTTAGLLTNVSVGVAATALPTTALTNRKSVRITNPSTNTVPIYIGYASTVTAGAPAGGGTQGVPLSVGSSMSLGIGPGIPLWGIVTTGTAIAQVEEIS